MRAMRIKDDVLGVLSRLEIVGNVATITDGQLDRKLYMAFNEVLEAIGGKWNRKLKGHQFTEDPRDQLDTILLTGEVSRPKDFDYFPTPKDIAERIIELAEYREPDLDIGQYTTLEPSAGEGAIAEHIPFEFGSTFVELDPKRAQKLKEKFPAFHVECADFMTWASGKNLPKSFDRVVMNPPFSKQQDIDHILNAWKYHLKDGGRLVSVMSAGVEFRENKKTVQFRDFIKSNRGTIEKVDDGAFKESGTMVRTVIVRVDKCAGSP